MCLADTDLFGLLTEWSAGSAFPTAASLAVQPVAGKVGELARSSYFISLIYPGQAAL